MKRISILLLPIGLLLSCSNKQPKEQNKKENLLYDKAFEYREVEKFDSAFRYFNQAKDVFLSQKDTFGAGKCLVNMGIISTDKGDYFGGQEISLNAIKYFNKNNKGHYPYIHSNYNNLGIATFQLSDFNNALKFYDLAIRFSESPLDIRLYQNNKAKVYQQIKNYPEALKIYKQVQSGISKNQKEYARALTNIAKTKWLQNAKINPIPDFLKSLRIREKEADLWGLNSSYSHLSDYYMKKGSDSAVYYAKKMYVIAREVKSSGDQLEALQKLVKLSPLEESRHYFEIYQNLNDSVQTARNIAKNQFALIRYETEKNKADFLKAQEENIKKQNSIVIGYIGIGILIAFSIASYFWYRRRQKILKQEKEIEVKNTEIKYAKKVHDHVANRIYQVMDEIDNRPQMDKDEVAEKLDVIYHISRDLSYENTDTGYKPGFAKALSKMFSSYQSAEVNIAVNGNEEHIWEAVRETVKIEVFTILQELMTNMRKHSEADVVRLAFQHDNGRITVLYSDNGKGIQRFSPGNGLKNTETRIKSISGVITFDSKANQGLNVKFSFPI